HNVYREQAVADGAECLDGHEHRRDARDTADRNGAVNGREMTHDKSESRAARRRTVRYPRRRHAFGASSDSIACRLGLGPAGRLLRYTIINGRNAVNRKSCKGV